VNTVKVLRTLALGFLIWFLMPEWLRHDVALAVAAMVAGFIVLMVLVILHCARNVVPRRSR
jgi:uncharacterized membrane protein YhiD involved in acid resistance